MSTEEYKKIIDAAADKCLAGIILSTDELVELLDIPVCSEADDYLQQTAGRVSSEITGDKGYLWCSVGMDFAPCDMNCRFCSFGAEWGLIHEVRQLTPDEIIENVRKFVEGGAGYVALRTTEFYKIDDLLAFIPKIREAVPGDYQIIFNTGEMDLMTAEYCAEHGVYGAYHCRRLREGVDTPFDPAVRLSTMRSIGDSQLTFISHVEPIGEEHTSREMAERFADIIACGAEMSGLMARVPVPGTPLGETTMISEDKIAHITAALRLAGGRQIKDICTHPATEKVVRAGANVIVVEFGAIPRDANYSSEEWEGITIANRRELLEKCNYTISMPEPHGMTYDKSCPCNGGSLDKFMQPIILHILSKDPLNGYATQKRMAEYATFCDAVPDMSATYRYLKKLVSRGILMVEDGRYSLTDEGRECLDNWKKTISFYEQTIKKLKKQLES